MSETQVGFHTSEPWTRVGRIPPEAYPTRNCCRSPRIRQGHPLRGPEDPRGDLEKEERAVRKGGRLQEESRSKGYEHRARPVREGKEGPEEGPEGPGASRERSASCSGRGYKQKPRARLSPLAAGVWVQCFTPLQLTSNILKCRDFTENFGSLTFLEKGKPGELATLCPHSCMSTAGGRSDTCALHPRRPQPACSAS